MKTIMTSRVTDGMSPLNNYTSPIGYNAVQAESQSSIIESIIETIYEPIIYKC